MYYQRDDKIWRLKVRALTAILCETLPHCKHYQHTVRRDLLRVITVSAMVSRVPYSIAVQLGQGSFPRTI